MKNCVDIDEGKGIGRKKKLWNYTAEKNIQSVNCMLVHFADKLTKGEQKWMKKCSNAAFLQCNVIMTCRFCDSIKRYVDVVLLSIFLLRQCSRCVFYLLYHNLFEFGGFFSTESWIGCSFTVCYYNFYTFHISNGHFFSAVVIRPIAKNSVLMTTVMNIKLYRRLFICTFHAFADICLWAKNIGYVERITQCTERNPSINGNKCSDDITDKANEKKKINK